ncbi:GntR family transcriptional regulator [Parafrankia irregularis]|nr:GntR family transcriptional regulator [Parafrankia irregularis]
MSIVTRQLQPVKGSEYIHGHDFSGGAMTPARRHVPAYQRVADDLRTRIEAGEFGETGRLPTEPQLQKQYSVSSTTARNAVKRLAAAGIVETIHGSGTYVIDHQLLTIYATHSEDLDRREGITAQDSWMTDVLEAMRRPSQRFECLNVPATADQATLLDVEPNAPLVMRRCWRSVDDVPASIEASIFPRWLVDEIPELASPHDISQGTTSFVAERGHPMRLHRDYLSGRPLTAVESGFFEAPAGVFALIRQRVSYETPGGRVLRVTETVYRSDMHRVVYDVAGRGNERHP